MTLSIHEYKCQAANIDLLNILFAMYFKYLKKTFFIVLDCVLGKCLNFEHNSPSIGAT